MYKQNTVTDKVGSLTLDEGTFSMGSNLRKILPTKVPLNFCINLLKCKLY